MTEEPEPRDLETLVLNRLRHEIAHVTPEGRLQNAALDAVDLAAAAFAKRKPHNIICVYLPLTIPSRAQVDDNRIGLAAACTAIYIGARFLDDVIDGHDPLLMEGNHLPEATVIGAAFLSTISFSIINRLDLDSRTSSSLTDSFAQALARLGDGQLNDIATFGRLAGPNEVLHAIRGKTGWLFAMYARASLRLSTDDASRLDEAAKFGIACGTARQLLSDCQRLTRGDHRSIERHPCLYPIAVHHAQLDETERSAFADLYRRYGEGEAARSAVSEECTRSGSVAKTIIEVELYRASAEASLQKALLNEQPDGIIMKMIGNPSI